MIQRYRHSRGYGLHSPRLYYLLHDVVQQRSAYYCYDALRREHHRRGCNTPLHECELLFRLANEYRIECAHIVGCTSDVEWQYIRAARRNCRRIMSQQHHEHCFDTTVYACLTFINLRKLPVEEAIQIVQTRPMRKGDVCFVSGKEWRAAIAHSHPKDLTFDLGEAGLSVGEGKDFITKLIYAKI